MKIYLLIAILLGATACTVSTTSTQAVTIPASIDSVQTEVVGDSLVRVIRHNMEINPVVTFEIIKRPDFTIHESITLNDIPIEGNRLNFKRSSGVYIESLKFDDDKISIELEYYPLKGEAILALCKLPVSKDHFGDLSCFRR